MRPHRRPFALAAVLVLIGVAWAPLAGGSVRQSVSAETIAARQHFFGSQYVDATTGEIDPDVVVLSWFSVSSVAMAIGGEVVLLDTYFGQRDDEPGWVPTTLQELVELDPVAIVVGHGHADHIDTAGYLAATTGATVVGTAEHCSTVQSQAEAAVSPDAVVDCIAIADVSAEAGAVATVDLIPGVCIDSVKHVHSASEPRDSEYWRNGVPPSPVVPILKPDDAVRWPPGSYDPNDDASQGGSEGGSVYYQFRVGDFGVGWFDTVGPLKERAPGVLDQLAAMPPTDIALGAIWGSNLDNNGLRDPIMYIEAIEPSLFTPLHFDFDYGSFSYPTVQEEWKRALEDDFEYVDPSIRPTMHFLLAPDEYISPELSTFEVADASWQSGDVAGRSPERCARTASVLPGVIAPTATTAPTATGSAPSGSTDSSTSSLPATGTAVNVALAAMVALAGVLLLRRSRSVHR